MANIRLVKGRIKSAKNIAQITKAMELVAASKMKKAQSMALAGKLYAQKIYEMVANLGSKVDKSIHPFLAPPKHPTGKKLVIVISTNKGLCGGLNTNLFRFLVREYITASVKAEYVTLGQKGADLLVRTKQQILADFSTTVPFTRSVPALIEFVTQKYSEGLFDSVDIVYSDFITALKQIPRKKTILPLTIESVTTESAEKKANDLTMTIEPSESEVFATLLPHYLENQLRDAVLEAEASEHSSRMIAMRNATDNAMDLMEDLTLIYNRARQEKITYEITDMVTARLAAESQS